MVMPYLNFSGDCEEAFQLYVRAFGGTIEHMVRYGDMPENPDAPLDEAQKRKVMHAQIRLTQGGCLSGADAVWPYEQGSAVHIHVHLPTEAEARSAFAVLAEAGAVLAEIARNPPPDDSGVSGAVCDPYGFQWVLSAYGDDADGGK